MLPRLRSLLPWLALLAALLPGAASAAPKASDLVRATLVTEHETVQPGGRLTVGLHLVMRPGWHVYWRNPGDSGLAPEVAWTLPAGAAAGPILWPVPHRIPVAHLVNFGFEGETTLLTEITVPSGAAPGSALPLKAELSYLVCERECVPGEASLSASVRVAAPGQAESGTHPLVAAARAALPLPSPWPAHLAPDGDGRLALRVVAPGLRAEAIRSAVFFPNDETAIEHAAPQDLRVDGDGLTIGLKRSALATGPAPADLPGTLVIEELLPDGTTSRQGFSFGETAPPPPAKVAAAPLPPQERDVTGLAWAAMLAFLGGVILNLMPCVFPVLSIKLLSLVRHSGGSARAVRLGGLAYTAGVVLSFAGLAGLLLAVRAGGAEVGWGFQLQSPALVAGLAFLLAAVGLSLSGAFEVGAGLAGLAGRLDRGTGLPGSFGTGVLAALVATPCTAPFMGAAVGYALAAPAPEALAVFLALGLGLAAPFLLVACLPGLLAWMPRPGAWMERLKEVLAFPVYATVAWLLYVLSRQVSPDALFAVMVGLVLLGFAVWLLRATASGGAAGRWMGRAAVTGCLALLAGIGWTLEPSRAPPAAGGAEARAEPGSAPQPFSQARLDGLRADGRTVFVNMTAAWCITCLVNERTSLSTRAVQEAFSARDVAYLKGDWTNRNPEITRLLERHGRSGVPLYLLFPRGGEPTVLPQILTEAIVLDSLGRQAAEAPSKRAQLGIDPTRR